MTGAGASVSVCLPAYNEAATIRQAVEEASAQLEKSGLHYELLVCDDGSTDRTGEILAGLAARIPQLRVLTNRRNRGIRYTFERLYHEASLDWVFLNSTDGQWPMDCLFGLLELSDRYDIVIASRRDKHYGPLRSLVSWGFNAVPRWLFGVQTYDAGATKLVRRQIIERFPLVSRSPFNEAERLIRAARAGYRIAERPIETQARATGSGSGASLSNGIEALQDVWRVWRDLRRQPVSR